MTVSKAEQATRKAERVLIDGRMTCVREGVPHGSPATYGNYHCRCQSCTDAHTKAAAIMKEARLAETAANGGIAPLPRHKHGRYVYRNWNCRCEVCVLDHEREDAERARRSRTVNAARMKARAKAGNEKRLKLARRLRREYEGGLTIRQVGALYGYGKTYTRRLLLEAGTTLRPQGGQRLLRHRGGDRRRRPEAAR